jgi:hypothetical protein
MDKLKLPPVVSKQIREHIVPTSTEQCTSKKKHQFSRFTFPEYSW